MSRYLLMVNFPHLHEAYNGATDVPVANLTQRRNGLNGYAEAAPHHFPGVSFRSTSRFCIPDTGFAHFSLCFFCVVFAALMKFQVL